jgi:hypothetical protein
LSGCEGPPPSPPPPPPHPSTELVARAPCQLRHSHARPVRPRERASASSAALRSTSRAKRDVQTGGATGALESRRPRRHFIILWLSLLSCRAAERFLQIDRPVPARWQGSSRLGRAVPANGSCPTAGQEPPPSVGRFLRRSRAATAAPLLGAAPPLCGRFLDVL